MEGTSIIYNQTNNRKYAQIDLDKFGVQWEEFYDCLMVEMVKYEESIPLDGLGQQLKVERLLNEL